MAKLRIHQEVFYMAYDMHKKFIGFIGGNSFYDCFSVAKSEDLTIKGSEIRK